MANQPKRPLVLQVQQTLSLSPSMQRLTLTGPELADFPEVAPGAYVKLMFTFDNQPVTWIPESLQEVQLRTYTVRFVDQAQRTLTIDMALHGADATAGPASHWATQAKPGDKITVGGPGSVKGLPTGYDWLLMVGDITALPAIASHLEQLPATTQGYAVIKVPEDQDKIELTKPPAMQVIWHVETEAVSTLSDTVSELTPAPGIVAAWAACEFSDMRALRTLFRQRWNINHEYLYISSYWRKGRREDQHKVDKQRDQQEWESRQTA